MSGYVELRVEPSRRAHGYVASISVDLVSAVIVDDDGKARIRAGGYEYTVPDAQADEILSAIGRTGLGRVTR